MAILLRPAQETEAPILRNLYSLYLHDLSKYTTNIDIGQDGFFHYSDLDLFWGTEGISPYFIKSGNDIIGFLLLLERPFLKKENDFSINDIFILNKYRGKGFGRKVLEILFEKKRGAYYVIELVGNLPAVSFWKNVFTHFHIEFEEKRELVDDDPCLIQTFTIE